MIGDGRRMKFCQYRGVWVSERPRKGTRIALGDDVYRDGLA